MADDPSKLRGLNKPQLAAYQRALWHTTGRVLAVLVTAVVLAWLAGPAAAMVLPLLKRIW